MRHPEPGADSVPPDDLVLYTAQPAAPCVSGTSEDTASDDGSSLLSFDPATGQRIGAVPRAGANEIDRGVAAAAMALRLWRGTTFQERVVRLARLADLLRDQAEEIASVIAREQGKPLTEALALEVLPALDHLRFLAGHAARLATNRGIWPRHPLYAHKVSHVIHDPIGIVAIVTSSSLPFARPMIQVGAALAMGNAVVLKPSELAPLCGERVGRLVEEAGFPKDLVTVLHTAREEALFLVAHERVDKIFFTGTRETAHLVIAGAGLVPRPMVMALGGKHPALVAGDADLDRAARGIVWGALANCGQNCGSVERVYVEQTVAARFVERVLREVDHLRVGNPMDPATEMGPLVSEERRSAVHAQVSEAVAAGAHRLRGGTMPEGPGYFYPPTVLLDVPPTCQLMREETLGPVIPIVVVDSIERGILMANDSDYALSASGWTASPATAERIMLGLQAGIVTINDVLYSFGEPAATWAGFKGSGSGYTHGTEGLREMCRLKFASHDPLASEAPAFAFPYDEVAARLVRTVLAALHGASRPARLSSLLRLVLSRRFRKRVPLASFLPVWTGRGR